jgi:hypothetical protein
MTSAITSALDFFLAGWDTNLNKTFHDRDKKNTNLVVILLLFIITEPAEMRLFNDFTIDLALEGIKLGISDAKERKGKITYLDPHRHHPSPAQHYRIHPTWTDFAHNA